MSGTFNQSRGQQDIKTMKNEKYAKFLQCCSIVFSDVLFPLFGDFDVDVEWMRDIYIGVNISVFSPNQRAQ